MIVKQVVLTFLIRPGLECAEGTSHTIRCRRPANSREPGEMRCGNVWNGVGQVYHGCSLAAAVLTRFERKAPKGFLGQTNQRGYGGSGFGKPFPISNLAKVHQTGESSRIPGSPSITASWFPGISWRSWAWAQRSHGDAQVFGIELLVQSMERGLGDAIPAMRLHLVL